MWDQIGPAIGALVPSVGVLAVFLLVVRSLVLADRRERQHRQREDAEIAARLESRERSLPE